MTIINFTKYFTQERDVYCQNISNCQVVVDFEISPGHSTSYTFMPTRDPINLTRYVPFNAIKNSISLRKILNRTPPVLRLMDEDEYLAYYRKQAKNNGFKTVEQAIEAAEQKAQRRDPLPNAPEPINLREEEERRAFDPGESPVNPRILNLCLQVSPSVPDPQKMTAPDMLAELESMPDLKYEDWEYVAAHGYYKSVINYAKKQMSLLAASTVVDDVGGEHANSDKGDEHTTAAKPQKKQGKHATSKQQQKGTKNSVSGKLDDVKES